MNKEKKDFILGLAIGIAAISVVALIILTIAYTQKGVYSQKISDSDSSAQDSIKNAPTPTPTPTPAPSKPSSSKVDVKISDSDHYRGDKDAPITIVEFSDFQCPFCSRFHDTMLQVIENYPKDVKWVYKHFPLDSIHPYAREAAEASECAGEQGKFWEYTDSLYANQKSINSSYLNSLAREIGLNTSKFDKCLADGKYAKKVNDDFQYGKQIGVTGTPGGYINGQKIGGALPYNQLESMIESLK